jgi:hypothetical protein
LKGKKPITASVHDSRGHLHVSLLLEKDLGGPVERIVQAGQGHFPGLPGILAGDFDHNPGAPRTTGREPQLAVVPKRLAGIGDGLWGIEPVVQDAFNP